MDIILGFVNKWSITIEKYTISVGIFEMLKNSDLKGANI